MKNSPARRARIAQEGFKAPVHQGQALAAKGAAARPRVRERGAQPTATEAKDFTPSEAAGARQGATWAEPSYQAYSIGTTFRGRAGGATRTAAHWHRLT